MVLISHILIAVTSLIIGAVLVARPSHTLVKVGSGLIAATLASGTVLVFQGANLWHLCMSGLLFTTLSVAAVAVALRRMKLAEQRD